VALAREVMGNDHMVNAQHGHCPPPAGSQRSAHDHDRGKDDHRS
jgi:hypothetical protein